MVSVHVTMIYVLYEIFWHALIAMQPFRPEIEDPPQIIVYKR